MLWVKILTGPYAGQMRTDAEVAILGISPMDLLADLARKGWRWEIQWPAAPYLEWAQADLVGRVFLALLGDRAVRFMGVRWFLRDSVELEGVVGQIEDALVGSGRNVVVLVDDGVNDLVIGVHGYEGEIPK